MFSNLIIQVSQEMFHRLSSIILDVNGIKSYLKIANISKYITEKLEMQTKQLSAFESKYRVHL